MTADLQELFDQAGRNPPTHALDADALLHRARARRSRNRRTTGAVAAAVTLALVVVVGLASQRRLSADPVPAVPSPIVQPSGSLGSLAYGLDGDIYLADWDGSNPVRIADGAPSDEDHCPGYWGEGPLWSPDGRYLAYRGDGGEDESVTCNRTVNISDSAGHRVASFPGEGWNVAWSPDSTRVAVWEDFYGDAKLQIYGLDGVRQALLSLPPGWRGWAPGDVDPVWSPDGASLLVPLGTEVPVDGSTPKLPEAGPRSEWMATYSPDRTEIAYLAPDGLTVAAADGSQARLLVPGDLDHDFPMAPCCLAWSPEGDRIAFGKARGRSRESGRATELTVLDVASGRVVPLADMGGIHGLTYVKFSPEGDRILFATAVATGGASLWSVQADGSDLHQLVDGTALGDWQTLVSTP